MEMILNQLVKSDCAMSGAVDAIGSDVQGVGCCRPIISVRDLNHLD